jgi:hypothetical protein
VCVTLAVGHFAPAAFIHPCQPIVAKQPPSGAGWAHELKHDGYRLQIHVRDGRVRLCSLDEPALAVFVCRLYSALAEMNGAKAYAQSDATSGAVLFPSCIAAADIVQSKHPAADSEDAAKQLRLASGCFAAVTAIMRLQPLFKPEFAVCPPADISTDSKVTLNNMILVITAHLRNHPEQRPNNFHQTAVAALVSAWPCSK